MHHDALELPDGQIILLTHLKKDRSRRFFNFRQSQGRPKKRNDKRESPSRANTTHGDPGLCWRGLQFINQECAPGSVYCQRSECPRYFYYDLSIVMRGYCSCNGGGCTFGCRM